jgi:hypothetical protein
MKKTVSNQEAGMSTKAARTDDVTSETKVKQVAMKLEVVVPPVSDVDRVKGRADRGAAAVMSQPPMERAL